MAWTPRTIPCATKLITHAASIIGPSRESPSRNFNPESTPFCCAAASTRLPARPTIAVTSDEEDNEKQRPQRTIREEHRIVGAELGDDRPRRDAEDGDRQQLGRKDPAHLGGGSRCHEDEERKGDERHRRAGKRDELGGDEADEGTVLQHEGKIKRTYGFVK